MRFSGLKRWGRIGGAWLVLAAVGVFAPTPARAGCAHPIDVRSSLLDRSGQLDGLITGDVRQAADSPWGAPANRKPCSGPGCSSSKPPIPIPTASTGLDGMPHWGALDAGRAPEAAPRRRMVLDPAATLHAGPTSTIFHPPRV